MSLSFDVCIKPLFSLGEAGDKRTEEVIGIFCTTIELPMEEVIACTEWSAAVYSQGIIQWLTNQYR